MIQFTQDDRFCRLDTPLGNDVLMLKSCCGSEALSRDFAYHIVALSIDAAIDGNAIVGKRISMTCKHEDGRERFFNGFVSRFEFSEQTEDSTELTSYQLTMVPWLWFLKHNRDCQIFQEMTAPDIIKQIFLELGFTDFNFNLNEEYPEREYCVQYNETDFDFVSRLMEEEGIFYYFEHTQDEHTLVMCDAASGYVELNEQGVRYSAVGQAQFEQLTSWTHTYEFRPGKMAQKDFNFKKPTDGLKTDKKSRIKFEGSSNLEVYEYPGRYDEGPKGDRLTKVRLEELEAEHDRVQGSGYYFTFAPGGKFEVSKHGRPGEETQSYVLVEVSTEFHSNIGFEEAGDSRFRNSFSCIPAETAYRPPRFTRKPVMDGPQTAIIVTDGQEIVVDEHARVKVQFHWDRYGQKDINSSCWIRVSQHHAGKSWGMIDIPRQHEEVIVSFLDGDPDRPIITGRVYNGDNQPPFGLKGAGDNAKNKTRRGNMTKTYEGTGYNEMTMDDTAGKEQIRVHAQYDMNSTVLHDETLDVGNDRTKNIGNDEKMMIGNDQFLTVGNDRGVAVGNDHTETVGNNQTVTIGKNQSTTVGQSYSLSISNQMTAEMGASKSETIGDKSDLVVAKDASEQVGKKKKVVVGTDSEHTASKNIKITAGMKVTIEANATLELKCGASKITLTPGVIIIQAPMVKIN